MALRRTSLTEEKIEQTFNLKKLLGYSPSDEQKKLFYELAVDAIVERTASGKDVNGSKFKKYNKDYASWKGVSVNSVDLILTGDMLNGFEEGSTKDSVKIAIKSDEVGKAHGNITGSYGQPFSRPSKARDFFGFKKEDELKPILREVDRAKDATISERIDAAELRRAIEQSITLGFEGF